MIYRRIPERAADPEAAAGIEEDHMFHAFHGQGRPMLAFVHGLACAHEDWVEQVAHFEARHRCLCLDLPGHGRTPADAPLGIERFGAEVAELVASTGEPVVLVGHSMGCRVCLEAACRLGDQLLGLVLVDGSCFAEGDPEAVRRSVLEAVGQAGLTATIDGLFVPMFTDQSPREFRQRALERARTLSPEHGPGLLADMQAWDAGLADRRIAAVRVPVLAIQSTRVDANRKRSILRPGETAPWTVTLSSKVHGARIEYMPGVGHFTMYEAPEAVNRLLEEFLASL